MLAEVEGIKALAAVEDQPQAYPTHRQALFITILVVAANLLSMIDFQTFPLLVTPIKAEFNLSDLEVGSLQGLAMSLMLVLCVLPAGYLADKTNRVKLYACAVLLWSLFTALSGLCTNYGELFFFRAATGMAESVAYPTAFSLIADLYDAQTRTKAIFIYYCATSVIMGLSTILCGLLISGVTVFLARYGHGIPMLSAWRMTFFLAAIPGLILAALFLRSREPTRQHRLEERRGGDSIWYFLIKRPLLSATLLLAPALSWIGSNAFLFWLPTILTRQFGFHLDTAGETFGLAIGLGTAGGTFLSAFIAWRMRKRSELLSLLTPFRVGLLGSMVFTPIFLLAKDSGSLLLIYLLLQTSDYIAVPAVGNMIIRVTPGHLRGRIFGMVQFTCTSINMTLPPIIGALSDNVFSGPSALFLGCMALSIPTSALALLSFINLRARFSRAMESPELERDAVVAVQYK